MVAEFRSTGAIFSGTTSMSGAGMPAGIVAGDILLSILETDGTAPTPPSGWADVMTPVTVGSGATASRLHLWWKRAVGGDTAPNFTAVSGLDHVIHRCIAIKDCPLTGDPWESVTTTTDVSASTTCTFPNPTTSSENTLFVHAVTTGFDAASNNTSHYTAFSGPSLSNGALRVSNARIDGNGGTIGLFTGRRLPTGVTTASTATAATTDPKCLATVVLKTAPPGDLPIDVMVSGTSTTDGTVFTSNGSMSPEPDSRVLAYIYAAGTAVPAPTLSGSLGLTWTLERTRNIAGTGNKLFLFSAPCTSSPSATVTMTFGSTATAVAWGFLRTRRAGSPPGIVQIVDAEISGNPLVLTMAAATDAANREVVGVGVNAQNVNNTITPETGWLEDVELLRTVPAGKLYVAKNLGTFDTSPTVTEDGVYDMGGIAVEVDLTAGGITGTVDSDPPAAASAVTGTSSADAVVDSDAPAGSAANTATASTTATVDSDTAPVQVVVAAVGSAAAMQDSDGPSATLAVDVSGASAAALVSDAPAAAVVLVGESVTPITGTVASSPGPGQSVVTAAASAAGTVDHTAPPAVQAAAGTSEASGVLGVAPGPGTVQNTAQASTTAVLGSAAPAAQTGFVGEAASTGAASSDAAASVVLVAGETSAAGILESTAPAGVFTAAGPADFITGAVSSTAPSVVADMGGEASAAGMVENDVPPGSTTINGAATVSGVVGLSAPPGQVAADEASSSTGTLASLGGPAIVGQVGAVSSAATATITAAAGVFTAVGDGSVVGAVESDAAAGVFTAHQTVPVTVTYRPGEPYVVTTPGPPYIEVGVFGWGQGGWGEGPWGGTD